MVKTYRKTATIQAEQFDGSDEMIKKYNIRKQSKSFYNSSDFYYYIPTLEGDMYTAIGDYIVTGIKGEHWAIKEDIFNKSYTDLPVLPKEVAYFVEVCRASNTDLVEALYFECSNFDETERDQENIGDWISLHQDLFARAWLDGYTTEE